MPDVEAPLPTVVADLTFTLIRHGRATVPPGIWEEDREPTVGERVSVTDGSGVGPFEAVITEIDPDGALVLKVEVFLPTKA